MVGNINKANMKILAEADLLLIIILRGRRREKRKPRVWVRQVCWESSIVMTAVAVVILIKLNQIGMIT